MSVEERHQREKTERRESILAAASRAFARHGFDVTIETVAHEAEVAVGTVYLYFTSREDLYLNLALERAAHLKARYVEIQERRLDPLAELHAIVVVFLDYMRDSSALRLSQPRSQLHGPLRHPTELCQYKRVIEVGRLPPPVQKPRIPIWLRGTWRRRVKRAFKRAFAFDGFAGFRGIPGDDDHTRLDARDVSEIRSTASRQRPDTPFDIVVGGWPRGADLQHEREARRDCERAGATWWQEWVIGGPDQVRRIIRSGPVGAD